MAKAKSKELQVTMADVEDVFCSPDNPRDNDDAVDPVVESLKRFGWQQPLVAKQSGEIIAGNTRLKAAVKLGMKKVPVVYFEGDDVDAAGYMVADNRTGEFSKWNNARLREIIERLNQEGRVEGIGYTDEDIAKMMKKIAGKETVDDVGEVAIDDKNVVSRRGDVWHLGLSKLMCGDSTSPEDVETLMDGERACLFSTDPPYGVEYREQKTPRTQGLCSDGKTSGHSKAREDYEEAPSTKVKKSAFRLYSLVEELDSTSFEDFIRKTFAAWMPHVEDVMAFYMWHAHLNYPSIRTVMDEFKILDHQQIIWKKPTSTMGFTYYRWIHEPCIMGWRAGHKPPYHLAGKIQTVWEEDWEGKTRAVKSDHPTAKPLRLFELPMENHTDEGDLVAEPFCGSGSQLIAAARSRRRCNAMEISPAFVDSAVRRWQLSTGDSATLGVDGKTFDEISRDRLAKKKRRTRRNLTDGTSCRFHLETAGTCRKYMTAV